jgi:nucleoside-diphosphate-sugar epimerase
MSETFRVPVVARGEIIDDCTLEFGGRRGDARFDATDASRYFDRIVLSTPSRMADLHSIDFAAILDYLAELGERLDFDTNPHMREAFDLSVATSGLSESILRHQYENVPWYFHRDVVRKMAEGLVGIDYLEGWVPQDVQAGSRCKVAIRAFGSRAVHIIAGNVPVVAVTTVVRNAITRSDAIIKTPSNDPLTAVAIARTMVEMAPDHPLTRHLTVAYWKGGDEAFESRLYQPRHVEKIVAWGGFASIQHVSKYLQPGIDLITLDPKHSGTIIGREAFESETTMRDVARRAALDIGTLNQEGCINARVIYVVSGTDEQGLANARRLGEMVFEEMQKLPDTISTPHKDFDARLREEIDALRFVEDEYYLIGGRGSEGAIIVSREGEPVDFAQMLACRVANMVPIDEVDSAIRSVNAYTQTIGVYPDSLKHELRDRLAYQGGQRIVSLGGAASLDSVSTPQDGIEPVRRMCKWIVDETTVGYDTPDRGSSGGTNMKVLITGANGHIGAHVVRACESRGHEVKALVRKGADLRGLEGTSAEKHSGDIRDKESLRRAAEGCDAIIHMATVYKLTATDPEEIIGPAVEGARNVLEVSDELGIKRVVYTSSMASIGNSPSPFELRTGDQWSEPPESTYVKAKLGGERLAQELAREKGIDLIAICPTMVVGPDDYRITPSSQMLLDLWTGKTPTFPGGFNVVAVEDVALVHALALERGEPGKRYVVGSDNLTSRQMSEIAAKYGGKKAMHVPVPRAVAMGIVKGTKAIYRLLGREVPEAVKMAEYGYGMYHHYDIQETLATFDYQPISSEQAMKSAIEWLNEHASSPARPTGSST